MEQLFLKFSVDKLNQLESRIQSCLDRLSNDQIWSRDAETQNAVGNLVLHLCGNVRQWVIAGIGGKPDVRMRDREFAARGDIETADLKERLASTVQEASAVITSITAERLIQTVKIQAYEVSVLEAVYHVVEHFSHHTGQIIFAAKLFTKDDLGFYRHLQTAAHSEKTP